MKRYKFIYLLFFVFLTAALPVFAFTSPGPKAMGMGGAFTAVADDLSCVFWNPAGLPQTGYFDVDLSIAAGGENIESLEALSDIYKALEEKDYQAAKDTAMKIKAPFGFAPAFNLGIGLFKRVALSAVFQGDFDVKTLKEDVDSRGEYVEIEDTETALASGYLSFAYRSSRSLTLGMNVKYLRGWRHISHFKIYVDGETQDIEEGQEGFSDPVFSFDLGAIYQGKESPFTWGLMIENVTQPKLNFPELSGKHRSITLFRKINLGLSYKPLGFLTLAADIHNLTDNPTFHFGGELSLKLLKIRAGLSDGNLACGIGLNILLFNLEVSYYEKGENNPQLAFVLIRV